MYITKNPEIAQIAEEVGVDWIFVDMEFIGKDVRQEGLDTVQNHHTIEDIIKIKKCLKKSKVLVRINPIHNPLDNYFSSKDEIDATINAGADIIMLPFFKSVDEVKKFLSYVDGRSKTCLLIETPEAVQLIDDILEIKGIDMIHIGLNDLHLALKMKFMFELLTDGTVDMLSSKIKVKKIPFGFGGISTLEGGAIPGAMILKEHYRLGSSMVILSRSFCNADKIEDITKVKSLFTKGISDIRALENEASHAANYFIDNRNIVVKTVCDILKNK